MLIQIIQKNSMLMMPNFTTISKNYVTKTIIDSLILYFNI